MESPVRAPHKTGHALYPEIRYQSGLGPYHITNGDPSFMECVRGFGRYEYGLFAITTGIPAYMGYRLRSRELIPSYN